MNIMTILVLAVLVLCGVLGMRKGLVKKLAGVLSVIIASMLVSALLPHVTTVLKENTPVYDVIREQCERTVSDQIVRTLTGKGKSDSAEEKEMGREQIREIMDTYGLDSSRIDGFSDEQLQSYVDQYLKPYLSPITGEDSLNGISLSQGETVLDDISRIEQTKLIKNLPVPDFMKKQMLNYNNSEGYKALDVTGFGGYISGFIANVIMNIVAFIVTLVLTAILVRVIIAALGLISKLPVLNAINRLGGLAAGLIEGIFIVWIGFLVLSVFSGTKVGMDLMEMVDSSVLLKPVYETNMFLKMAMNAVSSIM